MRHAISKLKKIFPFFARTQLSSQVSQRAIINVRMCFSLHKITYVDEKYHVGNQRMSHFKTYGRLV